MSNQVQTETKAKSAAQTFKDIGGDSVLDRAIAATKQTAPDRARDLLETLLSQIKNGRVKWNINVGKTISQAVEEIDRILSMQVSTILHNEHFSRLEGSWRGLHKLVNNAGCSKSLKIRVLNAEKSELVRDFFKASEFDQSTLWKKVYESEFGSPGGTPYGILVGDYTISNAQDDINFVREMSHIAAASFCPFLTAPAPSLLGLESWKDIGAPRDLKKVFDSSEYVAWNSYRQSQDSCFVAMTLPRSMIRMPYDSEMNPIESFQFEEFHDELGLKYTGTVDHDRYCWTNSAYNLAIKMCESFRQYGWCTAIRGYEGGGRVDEQPGHNYISERGDRVLKCPSEVAITDRREKELSDLGFLPLCHYKNTNKSVFFGAQSNNQPKKYDQPDATANAAISARLPYVLATSRFAHFLKVMARDKIGSFQEAGDMERWMNHWILQYVNNNENASQDLKARYPLAEARIKVEEVPGSPGLFHAVAWLRPWMQFEELTTSMRLVAKLPSKAS